MLHAAVAELSIHKLKIKEDVSILCDSEFRALSDRTLFNEEHTSFYTNSISGDLIR